MGRQALRNRNRILKSKLSDEQFEKLLGQSNQEYVDGEVNRQIKFYQKLWTDCLIEAFKKNGINNIKACIILEDIKEIMLRKQNK